MSEIFTKIINKEVHIAPSQAEIVKNGRYFYTSSVASEVSCVKHENTSVVSRESRYAQGWKDNVRVLTKEELINILKNRK